MAQPENVSQLIFSTWASMNFFGISLSRKQSFHCLLHGSLAWLTFQWRAYVDAICKEGLWKNVSSHQNFIVYRGEINKRARKPSSCYFFSEKIDSTQNIPNFISDENIPKFFCVHERQNCCHNPVACVHLPPHGFSL